LKAYLILDLTIHNLTRFSPYIAAIPAHIARHGGRYIVQGAEAETIEGDWSPQRMVVLEFPSREAAKAFLADPECQKLFKIRHATTTSRLVLVDGSDPLADPNEARQFFLQEIDLQCGLAVREIDCGSMPLSQMLEACGVALSAYSANIDQGFGHRSLYLEDDELDRLRLRLGTDVYPQAGGAMVLTSWSASDGLPYRLHSTRELLLMLACEKPLALFYQGIPAPADFNAIPAHLFDRYVASGRFVSREYCEPNIGGARNVVMGLHFALYALAEEAWRIDAFIALRQEARASQWTDALTRREGELLGYSDAENDAFLARHRR
jgi:uncharacterized protein (DUF1330 family)